jgi:hypothetical protein
MSPLIFAFDAIVEERVWEALNAQHITAFSSSIVCTCIGGYFQLVIFENVRNGGYCQNHCSNIRHYSPVVPTVEGFYLDGTIRRRCFSVDILLDDMPGFGVHDQRQIAYSGARGHWVHPSFCFVRPNLSSPPLKIEIEVKGCCDFYACDPALSRMLAPTHWIRGLNQTFALWVVGVAHRRNALGFTGGAMEDKLAAARAFIAANE